MITDDMRIEVYGAVSYPEGTRVFRVIVPPGVVFDPAVLEGVLVESCD
jgi:hypothetical protein